MVREHFNHPCIFTWGILNECASDTEYGREVYQEQYNRLRELDQSRPLTSATCKHFCDICLDLPDIVSVNIYPLWYNDEPVDECLEKEYEWIQSAGGKGKPVLVSEIGAGAIAGGSFFLQAEMVGGKAGGYFKGAAGRRTVPSRIQRCFPMAVQ